MLSICLIRSIKLLFKVIVIVAISIIKWWYIYDSSIHQNFICKSCKNVYAGCDREIYTEFELS